MAPEMRDNDVPIVHLLSQTVNWHAAPMQLPYLLKDLAFQLFPAVLQQRTVNVAANQSDVHGCRSPSVFSNFTTVFRCGKAPVTAFAPFLLCRSALWLIVHTGHIVDGDKGLGVLAVDEVH